MIRDQRAQLRQDKCQLSPWDSRPRVSTDVCLKLDERILRRTQKRPKAAMAVPRRLRCKDPLASSQKGPRRPRTRRRTSSTIEAGKEPALRKLAGRLSWLGPPAAKTGLSNGARTTGTHFGGKKSKEKKRNYTLTPHKRQKLFLMDQRH